MKINRKSRATDLTRRVSGRHGIEIDENNPARATVKTRAIRGVMVGMGVRAGADPELGAGANARRVRKKRWRDDAVRKRR